MKRPIQALASPRTKAQDGFTLLELLVVLAILALLAVLTGPRVVQYLGKAKSDTARMQVSNIVSAVELYYLDTGRYPTAEAGLAALSSPPTGEEKWNGPYLKRKDAVIDPWGKAYHYRVPGEHGAFDVFSLGRDNAVGGTGEDTDLTNW